MCLSTKEAKTLFNLGFKRQPFSERVYPTDIYEYKNSVWCVGGRIIPNTTLLCETKIYSEGVWLPAMEDLLYWLDDNDCTFSLNYNGYGYKIEVIDSNDNSYKAKCGTFEGVLYNVIIKILEKYGGSPVKKDYEVIEAKFISREDL